MKGKMIYTNDNMDLIAVASPVPVVRRKTVPQITYPAAAYDDYGISGIYYYPSFGLSVVFIVVGFLILLAQFAFSIGLIWFAIQRKKSIRCKNCGSENFSKNGKFSETCAFCGEKLSK